MNPNILIVDDEPGIHESFELMLGDAFALRMVHSAEEALALPPGEAENIRVIFLDGALGPGISGERALPGLKAKFLRATIIYIGASAKVKASALFDAGVALILPKPWNVEHLQALTRQGMADPSPN